MVRDRVVRATHVEEQVRAGAAGEDLVVGRAVIATDGVAVGPRQVERLEQLTQPRDRVGRLLVGLVGDRVVGPVVPDLLQVGDLDAHVTQPQAVLQVVQRDAGER
jgi:hypothetical protein